MESNSIPLSLLSSKVYLSLIISPKSPTLSLFTPMAFNSLLRVIRRSVKDGRGPYTSSDDRRRGFGSSHRRVKGKRSLNSDEEEREREKNVLDVRLLFNVLDRLGLVVGLLHLERFPDSLKSLVQTVAEIPVLGSELCATTAEDLKFLSPLILMLNSQARTFALGFVIHRMMVMKKNSDAINKAVVNLPRYLLQKAPEKSEARALAVQSIMEIVQAMHFVDQVVFLDYVSKMAQGNGPCNVEETNGLENGNSNNKQEGGMNDLLRRRCRDEQAAVRKAAILVISKLMTLGGGLDGDILKAVGMACSDSLVSIRKAATSAL
ncbi:hypothetical protein Nepgr_013722 [Nepenthes gracilis]|uniref:Uncharacterized protein n=1 Tax=Nepenthes gracilis TaxID=150966 RepID=A0AAD3XPM4_NEPGR|nr:hypothetical protein Nepgr_013722 [Nepenthes gracilis]